MKILIIDDEKVILNAVHSQLLDMDLGMNRIDAVGSTKEARRLMKENDYDIFLCDIVMPEEDGITFAQKVLKECPDTKFVFLTAHADFAYMKAAISMQSFDYLLQPASRAELRDVVERAVSQIKLEHKNSEMLKRGSFFFDREDTILEEGTLRYCEGVSEDNSYLRRLIASRNVGGEGDCVYLPVRVQILRSEQNLETIGHQRLRPILQNILDEIVQPFPVSSILMMNEAEKSFFSLLCMHRGEEPERALLIEKMEKGCFLFQKILQTTVALYCGEICELERLQVGCCQTIRLEKDNVRKEGGIFQTESSRTRDKKSNNSAEAHLQSWKNLLERGRYEEFKKTLFHHIENCSEKDGLSMEYMVHLHQSVTELILGHMVNNGKDSNHVFDENLSYLTYMECWRDLEAFEDAIRYIMLKLRSLLNSKDIDFVEEALRYIRRNTNRELTVGEVGKHIGMNPEYLTRQFKKRTGHPLKVHIIHEKLEAAKTLLATTELPVTVIADHVGYGNYSNFTRAFRQHTGYTPMDYRRQCTSQIMQ